MSRTKHMNTTTTIAQEIAAADMLASSLMIQVQNLESGPAGDYDTQWSDILKRKSHQFNVLCEILQDLRAEQEQENSLDEDEFDGAENSLSGHWTKEEWDAH